MVLSEIGQLSPSAGEIVNSSCVTESDWCLFFVDDWLVELCTCVICLVIDV